MAFERPLTAFDPSLLLALHFDTIRSMETLDAAELLAALGHESGLSIFHLEGSWYEHR